ncbi:radical SAM protein [Candidatus Saccharibacteria bacterium]|nr:radical SAM protein [Candidatus Saccharibacteria bacterium]MCL1963174.1 radical SAM protein [Candidatus Saccharibacteria bacterium]
MKKYNESRLPLAFDSFGVLPTRRCPRRCGHCYRGDAEPVDLQTAAIDALFAKNNIRCIRYLYFSGGEPALNGEGALAFARALGDNNVEVDSARIFTACTVFSEPLVEAMQTLKQLDSKPEVQLMVSDDFPRETYESLNQAHDYGDPRLIPLFYADRKLGKVYDRYREACARIGTKLEMWREFDNISRAPTVMGRYIQHTLNNPPPYYRDKPELHAKLVMQMAESEHISILEARDRRLEEIDTRITRTGEGIFSRVEMVSSTLDATGNCLGPIGDFGEWEWYDQIALGHVAKSSLVEMVRRYMKHRGAENAE